MSFLSLMSLSTNISKNIVVSVSETSQSHFRKLFPPLILFFLWDLLPHILVVHSFAVLLRRNHSRSFLLHLFILAFLTLHFSWHWHLFLTSCYVQAVLLQQLAESLSVTKLQSQCNRFRAERPAGRFHKLQCGAKLSFTFSVSSGKFS